jgi:transcriptional regulator with PAS, ATPase and Fis domain
MNTSSIEATMITHAGASSSRDMREAHPPQEHFFEHLSETGCLTLVQWARREAPELLRALMKAFMTEHSSAAGSAKLRDIEREHIKRVLAASRTVHEAAEKLGINDATLWRKRKRYGLD